MLNDPDLTPFNAPERLTLRALRRNFLEAFPRSTYEQAVTWIRGPLNDTMMLCDPDLIHEMLVEKSDAIGRSAITWRVFAPVFGEASVFVAENAEWRWRRYAVSSNFRHETLLWSVPLIAATAARQVESWRGMPPDLPIDVAAAMRRVTLDIIVEAMLGHPSELDEEGYGQALTDAFEVTPWQTLLAVFSAPTWAPFPGRQRLRRARAYLQREIGRIVARRRVKPATRPNLLDVLIAARDPTSGQTMTDPDVIDNLLTFISTGHEPSTVGLAWTFWLIAKDEQTQQRIFDEVRAVAGEETIAAGHVERLVLARQAIEETMRLYPPAALLLRQAKVDTALGTHRIKSGTFINVPIYALHRNVRLWNDPNTFDPGRFASDQVKMRHRYAYLPFGAGPRVCIGASFAMIEMLVILATLVRAFRFRPVPGHKPKPFPRISLRPQGGMPLLIEPR